MARTLPFMVRGQCIDCGASHNRHDVSYRCRDCYAEVLKLRVAFSKFLKKAVRTGVLPDVKNMLCVDCEKPAEHWDHRDYRKLEEVQPVCRSCNYMRGPAAWRNYTDVQATAPSA